MTLPAAFATISMGDINVELGRSRTANISLDAAENGSYATININSTSRPSSTNPATISEWYLYNHNATPPSYSFSFSTSSSTNPATACGYGYGQTLYSAASTINVSNFVYTNAELTTPFNGLSRYWHSGTNAYRITTAGGVTLIQPC